MCVMRFFFPQEKVLNHYLLIILTIKSNCDGDKKKKKKLSGECVASHLGRKRLRAAWQRRSCQSWGKYLHTGEDEKKKGGGRAVQVFTFNLALSASLYPPCGRSREPANEIPSAPIHLKVSLESRVKLYLRWRRRRWQESARCQESRQNPALMTLFLGVLAPPPTEGEEKISMKKV